MLGINKSVVQTPKARMRIANNIYTRVNAKKNIIVKPITELTQEDLDASTSLFMVRVHNERGYVRDPRKITISWKDQWGRDFSKIVHLNIERQIDYQRGDRRLASIVDREDDTFETWGGCKFYGCLYFVLNAASIDEAAQHIETYANTMGGDNAYGIVMPKFCAQMDVSELVNRYSHSHSGGPPVPSHQDMRRDMAEGKRWGGTMKVRVKSTPTRTGGRSRKRRVRTQRAHRKRT
jgi:hypothetical protein